MQTDLTNWGLVDFR